MKKELKIPKFKDENKERNFWSKMNLSEYFEPIDFGPISLPDLKPSSRSISLRLPEYILVRLKEKANELNIPYQTLIKQYIAKGILQK